jgi:hypothetical protein
MIRFPVAVPNNSVDTVKGQTVLFGQRRLSDSASSVRGADCINLDLLQFGRSAFVAFSGPPLGVAIRRILLVSSLKQVRSVAAHCVIARVADQQRIGVDAVVEEVSHSVRSAPLMFDVQLSVSVLALLPRPALIRSFGVYLRPETDDVRLSDFRQWLTIVLGHVSSSYELMRLAMAGADTSAITSHFTKFQRRLQTI